MEPLLSILDGINMKEFLTTLITTLNDIEVKGKKNMDALLGCIVAAEHELAKIEAEETTGEIEESDNGE